MTERELREWMIESWIEEHVADLLAEAAFAEEPPRALAPPEIMALDGSLNTTTCMICSDIMEDFFENTARISSYSAAESEQANAVKHADSDEGWVIGCPVCMESTIVSNNAEAGLFILSHQVFHQFESNGALMRLWDDSDGETGQAGDGHG